MFKVKWINPLYFLVRIDRQKQFDKRHKRGILYNAPTQIFMRYNQQQGEIVAVGQGEKVSHYREAFNEKGMPEGMRRVEQQSAQSLLPQARIGDTLFFSHLIEGSVETLDKETREDHLQYLAYEDDTWRYYWVRGDFAYGVVKSDGSIYVTPHAILAKPVEEEVDSRDVVQVGSLFLLKNFKQNQDEIQNQIDQLQADSLEYQNQKKREDTLAEMERLTNEKNKIRFGAFHPYCVNEKFDRDCGRKVTKNDVLYYRLVGSKALDLQVLDIEVSGVTYNLLEPEFVVAVDLKSSNLYSHKNPTYITTATR